MICLCRLRTSPSARFCAAGVCDGGHSIRPSMPHVGSIRRSLGIFTLSGFPLRAARARQRSAKLRLPASWTQAEKKVIVDGCLHLLNLVNVQHMRVGGVGRNTLSGGQRRRVNIGMVRAPPPSSPALFLSTHARCPTKTRATDRRTLVLWAMTLRGLLRVRRSWWWTPRRCT